MGVLEDLIGVDDVSQLSREELERMVSSGRLAREEESAAARQPKTRSASTKKKSALDSIEVDLDDFT